MLREIFLVRHGQTDYNLKNIVQGRGVDSSINQTGRDQASKFYDKYGSLDFELVITSTLKRTKQTVNVNPVIKYSESSNRVIRNQDSICFFIKVKMT